MSSDTEKKFKVYSKTLNNVIADKNLAAEYIEELATQRDQLNEKLREVCEHYDGLDVEDFEEWDRECVPRCEMSLLMTKHHSVGCSVIFGVYARKIEQQRKEIMGED